ncbi:MAG: 50S ribosomal protein L17 [Alphaproteobacteria bacterium]
MRHKKTGRRLQRSRSHRQALLRTLSKQLIQYEQIKTTLPKAKELKRYIDKIITLGKKGGLHRRRAIFSLLRDETLVNKVFNILAKRYKTRAGGYSRLMKYGFRYGDNAPMAMIELVDRDPNAKPKGPKMAKEGEDAQASSDNNPAVTQKLDDKKSITAKKDLGGQEQVKGAPKIRKNVTPSG